MQNNPNPKTKGCLGCLGCFGFLIAIFVILGGCSLLVMSLTDSSGDNKTGTKEVKTYKMGDTIGTQNVEIVVFDKKVTGKVSDGYLYYKPDGENNKFLVLNVTIKNISKSMISLDSRSFQLFSGDTQYSPTMLMVNDGLNLDNINPGVQIKRKIFFDLPKEIAESKNLKLKIRGNFFSEIGGNVEVDIQ